MRIGVLGIGNVLRRDDALGPYVTRVLSAKYDLPPHVPIFDVGTADPLLPLCELDAAIVVDTLRLRGPPGQVATLDCETLLSRQAAPTVSHDRGLHEALLTLILREECSPRVVLVGAIPADIALGVGLSPNVHAAVPIVLGEVLRQLRAFGVELQERQPPLEAELWWERTADGGRLS